MSKFENIHSLKSSPKKTNDGLLYTPLKWIKKKGDENSKEISHGGYGNVKHINNFHDYDNNKQLNFVKKEFNKTNKLDSDKIEETMNVISKLKDADINTLELYTDGENYYSQNLNINGKAALSSNNDPPKFYFDKNKEIQKYENNKFTIENIQKNFNTILNIAYKASKKELTLYRDILLFIVNADKVKNQQSTSMNIIVGDHDEIRENGGNFDDNLAFLKRNLEGFIVKYSLNKEQSDEYIEKMNSYINLERTHNTILTTNGVKDILDFDLEEDTPIKFCDNENIDTDLDKEKITQILNKKENTNFSKEEIEFHSFLLNEKTKCFIGDLRIKNSYALKKRIDLELLDGNFIAYNIDNKVENYVFPKKVNGSIHLDCKDGIIKNTIFPDYVSKDVIIGVKKIEHVYFPDTIIGTLNIEDTEEMKHTYLPKKAYDIEMYSLKNIDTVYFQTENIHNINLHNLKKISNTNFPKKINGLFNLDSLKDNGINNVTWPEYVKSNVILNKIKYSDSIDLPEYIGGDIYLDSMSKKEKEKLSQRYPQHKDKIFKTMEDIFN